jgi:hypothetical protein
VPSTPPRKTVAQRQKTREQAAAFKMPRCLNLGGSRSVKSAYGPVALLARQQLSLAQKLTLVSGSHDPLEFKLNNQSLRKIMSLRVAQNPMQ